MRDAIIFSIDGRAGRDMIAPSTRETDDECFRDKDLTDMADLSMSVGRDYRSGSAYEYVIYAEHKPIARKGFYGTYAKAKRAGIKAAEAFDSDAAVMAAIAAYDAAFSAACAANQDGPEKVTADAMIDHAQLALF